MEGAESLSSDLHGADVMLYIFDRCPAATAHQQVFLEHCRVQSCQRTHDIGFSDHVQVRRTAIATSEHALYYGDSGAIAIEIARLRDQDSQASS